MRTRDANDVALEVLRTGAVRVIDLEEDRGSVRESLEGSARAAAL